MTFSDHGALVVIVVCAVGLTGNTILQIFALIVATHVIMISTLQWR